MKNGNHLLTQNRIGPYRLYKEGNMREYIDAREGHVMTNGEIFGKRIYLAEGMDKFAFYEISDTEYEAIMQSEEEDQ